jgi:acetyl esterase/lipase
VHTPKDLAEKSDKACIINAHGGGGIGGSPELEAPICCHMAVKNKVIVFNVEYRLAGSGAKAN